MQTRNMFIVALVAGSLLLSGAFLYNMEAYNNGGSNFSFEYVVPSVDNEAATSFGLIEEKFPIDEAAIAGVDLGQIFVGLYNEFPSEGVDGNYFLSNNADMDGACWIGLSEEE